MLADLLNKCEDSKHGMINRDHYMYEYGVHVDWNAKVCYSILDCVYCTRINFVLDQSFR